MTKKKKKNPILLVCIACILCVVALGGMVLAENYHLKKRLVKSIPVVPVKHYHNCWSNFDVVIPENWQVNQTVNDLGEVAFRLSSPDKAIVMSSPPPDWDPKTITKESIMKKLPGNGSIAAGEYEANRYRYETNSGEIVDVVSVSDDQTGTAFFKIEMADYKRDNPAVLKVLRSFTFKPAIPSVDEFIEFDVPDGWSRWQDQADPYYCEYKDKSFSLISNDFVENSGPGDYEGASINISRKSKSANQTVETMLQEELTLLETDKARIKKLTIGGLPAVMTFHCWEACAESYLIDQGEFVWDIGMLCDSKCSKSEATMEASIYGKAKREFIQSIRFK